MSSGAQRQLQVYLAGLQGQRPQLPVSPEALEPAANAAMTPEASGYLNGMTESMQANRAAFQRWRIVQHTWHDVSKRDHSIQLFNKRYPLPFLLAPIGVQSIVHADGELAVARVAASLGVPMIFSSASTPPLEQLAQAMRQVPCWFQLYWSKDPAFNASLLHRAEQAGCEAIVVTLDTAFLAWRLADLQNAYLPFCWDKGLATT
jgi:isopentenyl diphosphate isomerase/L-lactate dehydrogenase-like FMN-dependent dehydrogenase